MPPRGDTFEPQKMPEFAWEKIISVTPGITTCAPLTISVLPFPVPVRIRSSKVICPPFGIGTTVFGFAGFGIKVPLSRKLSIINPPKHCGGVFAAGQVHCELTGISDAVIRLPLTIKDMFAIIACDLLWSKAA